MHGVQVAHDQGRHGSAANAFGKLGQLRIASAEMRVADRRGSVYSIHTHSAAAHIDHCFDERCPRTGNGADLRERQLAEQGDPITVVVGYDVLVRILVRQPGSQGGRPFRAHLLHADQVGIGGQHGGDGFGVIIVRLQHVHVRDPQAERIGGAYLSGHRCAHLQQHQRRSNTIGQGPPPHAPPCRKKHERPETHGPPQHESPGQHGQIRIR